MKKIFILLTLFLLTACNNVNNINYKAKGNPAPIVQTPKDTKVYGSFSTNITDKKEGRLNNIELGCSALNGAKIEPGAVFSFNDRVGPRTEEGGYKEAIIFDGKGNKEKGIGGGICQISTTLYNAALDAGFEIVERHEHSRDVPYIKDGMDASVSYPSEDLKIKNTTNKTVTINATVSDDKLNVNIT